MNETTSQPVLQISGACYRYDTQDVLSNVDLAVGRGELYTLLGPNGAGKTTLVHAISARLTPQSGTVIVAGPGRNGIGEPAQQPGPAPGSRHPSLGIVPQQIALYPFLTARENLVIFGRLMKVPRREVGRRADAFLARAGLADRAHSRLATLSGGMKRRVNIGAALMHRPHLLVLDEPTVGVDLHAREAVHDLLLELRGDGIAILLTTHDMDQAGTLSDRLGIIHRGTVIAEGKPADLIGQVFKGGKEVVITLAAAPDPTQADQLAMIGLRPMRGNEVWSGAVSGSFDAAAPLVEQLAAAGINVMSVNVQEPSLGSVFFHLVGREFDA